MESLSDTTWDVVICGTGLPQSLLALALSRSDKKILHIDPNEYYGSSDAALSLQEAEEWAASCESAGNSIFSAASITRADGQDALRSRAYSLSLTPHLIHTRSKLLSQLVSSRAFRQVEFLAVGSFFIYKPASGSDAKPSLARIPSTREAVFMSTTIPVRAKRALMKFLKFVLEYDLEPQTETWKPHADTPLVDFLESQFKLDDELRTYVLTLTLSLDGRASTSEGLAMIQRHLTSMGMFGPGFAAVYPKWGGDGEIAQVACRAGAVGGATYMLGTGIQQLKSPDGNDEIEVELTNGVTIKSKLLVQSSGPPSDPVQRVSRLIAVIDAHISSLFEVVTEGAPTPAVAVIAFPPGSVSSGVGVASEFPIYVAVHSSDTGECPAGQSVLYLTTPCSSKSKGVLEQCLKSFLSAVDAQTTPTVVYQLCFEQSGGPANSSMNGRVLELPNSSLDLSFNDAILEPVHQAWKQVMGGEVSEEVDEEYMKFKDREGMGDDDNEYD